MKKKLLVLLGPLAAASIAFAADKSTTTAANPLLKSDTVVWVHLDYLLVRMYGTGGLS
jgi:hypothetical protein